MLKGVGERLKPRSMDSRLPTFAETYARGYVTTNALTSMLSLGLISDPGLYCEKEQ